MVPDGIVEGDDIPIGATIATGPGTSAELRLKPNGTIIKLAQSTSFTVAGLAGAPQGKNAFVLVAGKMRAVAAKDAQYQFSSQTAICAVRGTDFTFAVDEGAKALLMVVKGLVQFDKKDPSADPDARDYKPIATIPVAAGEAADAYASTFAAYTYTLAQRAEQVRRRPIPKAEGLRCSSAGRSLLGTRGRSPRRRAYRDPRRRRIPRQVRHQEGPYPYR